MKREPTVAASQEFLPNSPERFGGFLWLQCGWIAHQLAVAHLLAPFREHEWMNAQRLRNILDQHSTLRTQLYCFELELEDAALTTEALRRPAGSRRISPGVLFHSDRGIEFSNFEFRARYSDSGWRRA